MVVYLNIFNEYIWTYIILPLLIIAGLYVSRRLKWVQIRRFPEMLSAVFKSSSGKHRGLSSSSAANTALGASIGIGNIVGTSQAICMGGCGAIFWMWMAAILSMAIKYAEIFLSVRFGKPEGPVAYISSALGPASAGIYSAAAIGACLMLGCMTQAGGCISAISALTGECDAGIFVPAVTGLILSGILAFSLIGGIKRIADISDSLVPAMSTVFSLMCICVIFKMRSNIIPVFNSILSSAFRPEAVIGGTTASATLWGLRRGIFSNEAGLGSAALAHASAAVTAEKEALWGIFEVFADTVVICSLVAFTLLCSGVEIPYGSLSGAELMTEALSIVFGKYPAGILMALSMLLFAFTSMLSWSLYGQKCCKAILGDAGCPILTIICSLCAFIGCVLPADISWCLADFFNALMIIPNTLAIMLLLRGDKFKAAPHNSARAAAERKWV